ISRDERLLGGVLRKMKVSEKRKSGRERHVLKSRDQLGEGLHVPGSCFLDQCAQVYGKGSHWGLQKECQPALRVFICEHRAVPSSSYHPVGSCRGPESPMPSLITRCDFLRSAA